MASKVAISESEFTAGRKTQAVILSQNSVHRSWANLFNLEPNSCGTVNFQIYIICLDSNLTLISSQVQRVFFFW